MKLLVPVDYSVNSNAAIRYALHISLEIKCKIVFFHSSSTLIPTQNTKEEYTSAVSHDMELKRKMIIHKLKQIGKALNVMPDDIDAEYIINYGGSVVNQIVDIIKKENVTFVIMATEGASGLKKVFFGSVTTKVIEKAKVPVLVVPARYKYHRIDRIVYSADFKKFKKELEQVRIFAHLIGAGIEVLTFNHPAPVSHQEKERLLKEGVTFTEKVIGDLPLIEHLNTHLKNKPGYMLCMFTRPGSWPERFFRSSNTKEIALSLQFPLLAFHKYKTNIS